MRISVKKLFKNRMLRKAAAVIAAAAVFMTDSTVTDAAALSAAVSVQRSHDTNISKRSSSVGNDVEAAASSGTALKADKGYRLDISSNNIFASQNSGGFYFIEYSNDYDAGDGGYSFRVNFFDASDEKISNIYESYYYGRTYGSLNIPAYRDGDQLYILERNPDTYISSESSSSSSKAYSYRIIEIDMSSSDWKVYTEIDTYDTYNSFCIAGDGRIILSDGSRMYVYDTKGEYQNTSVTEYTEPSPSPSADTEESTDVSDNSDTSSASESSDSDTEESGNTSASSYLPDMGCSKIAGFDPSNGNIYYQGTSNWVYWGYDHEMAAAKVACLQTSGAGTSNAGNTITFNSKELSLLYQEYYYEREGSVEMLDGGYLAILDTFSGDRLTVIDSGKVDLKKITDTMTYINPENSSFSVTELNLSNADDAAVFSISTKSIKYENDADIGCRACYNPSNGKFYVMTGKNIVSEIDGDKKQTDASVNTTCSLYKVMTTKDDLIAVTKDGSDYFVQVFSEDEPSEIKIKGKSNLNRGESADYHAVFDSPFESNVSFTSSDPDIISISEDGKATAWNKGTADITVSTDDGELSDSMRVKVTDKGGTDEAESSISEFSGGKITDNRNENFSTYGRRVTSYLEELDDGRLMRVENTTDGLLVEYYTDGELDSTSTIKLPLDLFGGFYRGKDAYYVVSGQKNTDEDDSLEVIRVEKYDEDWDMISSCSIKAINTYYPFDAGSLRMTETNGMLFIHTCHEMYKSDDGYHHQANMTFKIDESDMEVVSKYTDVMNIRTGYVSHSFDQYIQTDGENIYRVDLGDAYPRGIAYTVTKTDSEVGEPYRYGTVFSIRGDSGNNYTGLNIAGFELAGDNAVIAGVYDAGSDDDSVASGDVRNLFVVTVDKNTGVSSTKYITDYDEGSSSTVVAGRLVKINDSQLMLMWVEMDGDERTFHYAQLDSEGNTASEGTALGYELSDCRPVCLSDGSIAWYVSDGKKLRLYKMDPFDIEGIRKAGDEFEKNAAEADASPEVTQDPETDQPSETTSDPETDQPSETTPDPENSQPSEITPGPDTGTSTYQPGYTYGTAVPSATQSPEGTRNYNTGSGTTGAYYGGYTGYTGYAANPAGTATSSPKTTSLPKTTSSPKVSSDDDDDDGDIGYAYVSGKITLNIKNKKSYKLSRLVKIKAGKGIKKVTLNGCRIRTKKGAKRFSFRLKRYRKYLKTGGKYNRITVTDKKWNTKNVRFKVKSRL